MNRGSVKEAKEREQGTKKQYADGRGLVWDGEETLGEGTEKWARWRRKGEVMLRKQENNVSEKDSCMGWDGRRIKVRRRRQIGRTPRGRIIGIEETRKERGTRPDEIQHTFVCHFIWAAGVSALRQYTLNPREVKSG
jgi:hypothetical protein